MQRRSLNSAGVRLFKLDYSRVLRMLKEYAQRCINNGAETVILVGSLAKGNYTAFSDADVIIIVSESRERPIDRAARYIDPTLPIDVEPRVYTREEIIRLAEDRAKLVEELVEHGVILAGSKQIIMEIRKTYQGGGRHA